MDIHLTELEKIRQRCTDDAGCWIWQGATNGTKGILNVRRPEGHRVTMNVRRRVAELLGLRIDGLLASCSCSNLLCVAPDCIEMVSRRHLAKATSRRLGYQRRPHVVAKIARVQRAHSKVMTAEKAAEVRASDMTGVEAAKKYGCSKQTISQIRRGVRWAETGSPFAGLGAR